MTPNRPINIENASNKIYLSFKDISQDTPFKTAMIDYSDELWKIVNESRIRTDGKYIFLGKKRLHHVIMEYWYGADCCKKMLDNDYVVDHIDNNGFNCLYENLYFLNRLKNWKYKGNYYDIIREDTKYLAAVNIYKKMNEDKFQITIGFNSPFHSLDGKIISKAYFGYDTNDYDLVLDDANRIVESIRKGEVKISELRHNRYKTVQQQYVVSNDGNLKPGNVVNIEGEWFIIAGSNFQIEKIAIDDSVW